jgi:hypothetical protein
VKTATDPDQPIRADVRRRLVACLCVLGLGAGAALPASAAAEPAGATTGETLVFGTAPAHSTGDLVVVPVECLGGSRGFCSGVVTLSWDGHRSSEPFSVRGGADETLFVPLRLGEAKTKPRKVRGVATTDQGTGRPSSTKAVIYVR